VIDNMQMLGSRPDGAGSGDYAGGGSSSFGGGSAPSGGGNDFQDTLDDEIPF